MEEVLPVEQVDKEFSDLIKRVMLPSYNRNSIPAVIHGGHVYRRIPSGNIGAEVFTDEEKELGRNSPCICGSGKKYKKCCGRI